jgi:hypothetical protein
LYRWREIRSGGEDLQGIVARLKGGGPGQPQENKKDVSVPNNGLGRYGGGYGGVDWLQQGRAGPHEAQDVEDIVAAGINEGLNRGVVPGVPVNSRSRRIMGTADRITGTAARDAVREKTEDFSFYPVNERMVNYPYRQLEFARPKRGIPKHLTYEFNGL